MNMYPNKVIIKDAKKDTIMVSWKANNKVPLSERKTVITGVTIKGRRIGLSELTVVVAGSRWILNQIQRNINYLG
jgi:hypothetical protein